MSHRSRLCGKEEIQGNRGPILEEDGGCIGDLIQAYLPTAHTSDEIHSLSAPTPSLSTLLIYVRLGEPSDGDTPPEARVAPLD